MLHFIWLLVVGDLLQLEGPEGNVQRRCSSEFNLKCQTNRGQQEIQSVTSELSACLCQAHQIYDTSALDNVNESVCSFIKWHMDNMVMLPFLSLRLFPWKPSEPNKSYQSFNQKACLGSEM